MMTDGANSNPGGLSLKAGFEPSVASPLPHFVMKGLLLAGGSGSRLYPLTRVVSKQLQPVYDKPMIYYPLTVLMAAGIREICLISTPEDEPRFRQLLGDGEEWGIRLHYRVQSQPRGIAEAFLLAEDFLAGSPVALMLGDNLFFGGDAFPRAVTDFRSGAQIFAYHVQNPGDYGVVELNAEGCAVGIEEKPDVPRSNYVVPGVYLYDGEVATIARNLQPSSRGELEITDVNLEYLRRGQLKVQRLSRGTAWFDAGTSSSLHEASAYVQSIEKRQGMKLGCPEEAALRRGFITIEAFEALAAIMPACEYRVSLQAVAGEYRRLGARGA